MLKNKYFKKPNWNLRKKLFGSVCREELINHEEFWKLISKILQLNKNSTYCYTGRLQIHKKWVKKFSIDKRRIKYLGWVSEPEKIISQMAFLIDGIELGHGMLAYEAMIAEVPIIGLDSPRYSSALKSRLEIDEEIDLKDILICKNELDLISLSKKLFNDFDFNSNIGKSLRKIAISSYDGDGFEKFKQILEAQ